MTMPTTQNQLVTNPPHHSRRSLRRCRIRSVVELIMFLEMARPHCAAGLACSLINRFSVRIAIPSFVRFHLLTAAGFALAA